MLIEFRRAESETTTEYGEDDGIPQTVASFISINPEFVSAVFQSRREGPDVLIIRLSDGRGFKVLSDYQEALQRLQSPQRQLPAPNSTAVGNA